MNEPSKRMTCWRYSGDSGMKKLRGGTAGPTQMSLLHGDFPL